MLTLYLPPALFIIVGAIAQVAFDFGALFNNGVAIGVLLWFMLRVEPRLESIKQSQIEQSFDVQESLEKVARSVLIFSLPNSVQAFKAEAANALVAELDEAKQKREARKEENKKAK